MRTHHKEYMAAMKSGGHTELFTANWDFHAAIHRAADAPAIALTMKNTLRYFPDFSYDVPGWNELAADWQTGLLDQFVKGNREGARAVVAGCCRRSAELYITLSGLPGKAEAAAVHRTGLYPVAPDAPRATARPTLRAAVRTAGARRSVFRRLAQPVIETAARASPSPPSTGAATHAIPREDSSCSSA